MDHDGSRRPNSASQGRYVESNGNVQLNEMYGGHDPNEISLMAPHDINLHQQGAGQTYLNFDMRPNDHRGTNLNNLAPPANFDEIGQSQKKTARAARRNSDHDHDYTDPSETGRKRGNKPNGRAIEVTQRKYFTDRMSNLKMRSFHYLETAAIQNMTAMNVAMYARRIVKRTDLGQFMSFEMANYVFTNTHHPKETFKSNRFAQNPYDKHSKDLIRPLLKLIPSHPSNNGFDKKSGSDTEESTEEEEIHDEESGFSIVNFVKGIPGPKFKNLEVDDTKLQKLSFNSQAYKCARDRASDLNRRRAIEREINDLKQRRAHISAQEERFEKARIPLLFDVPADITDLTETCMRCCPLTNAAAIRRKLTRKKALNIPGSPNLINRYFFERNGSTMNFYSLIDDKVAPELVLDGGVPGNLIFHRYLKRAASTRYMSKPTANELKKCRTISQHFATPFNLGVSNAYKQIVMREEEGWERDVKALAKKRENQKMAAEAFGNSYKKNGQFKFKILPLRQDGKTNKRAVGEAFGSQSDFASPQPMSEDSEDGYNELIKRAKKVPKKESRRNSNAAKYNYKNSTPISVPSLDIGFSIPEKIVYDEIAVPSFRLYGSPPITHAHNDLECQEANAEYLSSIQGYHAEMEEAEKARFVDYQPASRSRNQRNGGGNVDAFSLEEMHATIDGNRDGRKNLNSNDVPDYDRPSYVAPYERRVYDMGRRQKMEEIESLPSTSHGG
uniref:ANK_REP_REGION domain-containing protein n=1 Tax=Rhabditophanes sp. KR3021 TaxID=114890 RepID=A0AC35TUE0_9BILA